MQSIHLTHADHKPRINWLREIKLAAVGFISIWLVEIIFFLVSALMVWILWAGFMHALHLPHKQHVYLYNDQEVKYMVIMIGGMKRRMSIKRFCKRYKIFCQ